MRFAILTLCLLPSLAHAQHLPHCSPSRHFILTQSQLWSLETSQQNFLQAHKKQVLLQYAIDAPSENLRRELKNPDAFVRWAASVELNRREPPVVRSAGDRGLSPAVPQLKSFIGK